VSGPDQTVRPAAYGFRIEGLDVDGALALRGTDDWPTLSIDPWRAGGAELAESAEPRIDEDQATLRVPLGIVQLDRIRQSVRVGSTRRPEDAELVHPLLWPAAAVHARWRGWETLHAGAFRLTSGGGVWIVMAESGGGKSSLLAELAVAGYEVVADDLVVVDCGYCYAGPRCIDLKPDAASTLEIADRLSAVRCSERARLMLEPCDGRLVISGFVHLVWGDAIAVDRMLPSECLATVARHRRVAGLGGEPAHLLDLAGLPMVSLVRPRSWAESKVAKWRLLECLCRF
jgi:hypothetical protein